MSRAPEVRVERLGSVARPGVVARKGSGKGGVGGSQPAQHTPHEYPNTLRSRSTARILELLSEGPVAGLHTDGAPTIWHALLLDGTPIADLSGNFQFNITQGDFRYGYPLQDSIPGWPMSEAEQSVGVECKPFDPVVRRLTSPDISAVRYKIRIPALYTQESDGDLVGASVAYALDVAVDFGPWTNLVTETVYGKTMSPYVRAVRVQLWGATTDVQIRIERLDPDPPSDTLNQLFFSSYTEIIDGQIAYDDSCVASMVIDAEDFPTVPQRAYLLDGIMVQIPTSYDGWNHADTGAWDGTFHQQWTNNPAWVLYALLTNERWGLGRYLDGGAPDKWSFYEAQLNNDVRVANGKGSVEPRWTCNCVINTRQDAWQVLTAVASSMLCNLYWANGTVFLVQDKFVPSPTRLFGPADVDNGLFDYTGADYRSQFTAAAITWNDPDDSYNSTVELVQDPTLVALQGYRETQKVAFGCTSRAQAQRFGRWLIYTSQFETEVVTFRVGLENADIRPGERIAISDPSRAGARLAGRVVSDDGPNNITLDKVPTELEPGWQLAVAIGSATDGQGSLAIIMLTVTGILAGGGVQVDGKTRDVPAGSMWLASSSAVEPTPWRVASVADRGGGLYEVTATEYHEEKFTYVDTGVLIPPPSFSLIPTGPLLGPTNVTHREYVYLDGNGWPQFGIVLSWTPSLDPRVAWIQVELAGPAGDYRAFHQITGVGIDVQAMRQGAWSAAITGLDNIGRKAPVVTYAMNLIGLTALPLPPEALYLAPQGGNLTTVTWLPSSDIDVVFFWLKWSPQTDGSATWDRATTSVARVARNTSQISTPLRSGTFMMKAIDSLGQESVGYAIAILLPQQTESAVIMDENEGPAWAGDRGDRWHVYGGAALLPPPSAPEDVPPGVFPGDRGVVLNQSPTRVAAYGFANTLDVGDPTLLTMTAMIEGVGERLGTLMAFWLPLASQSPLASGTHYTMSDWVPLAAARPIGVPASDNWDAHIEAQVSRDGATWEAWFPLKSSVITARTMRWRLVGSIYDLATTLRVTQAQVRVELPVRSVTGNDVPLDDTGHATITYAVPFYFVPNVQLTARQGLVPGGNIVLVESERDHFTVEGRNASGDPVPDATMSIDYLAQGFGGHA